MNSDVVLRIVLGTLFAVVIVVRRVFERRAQQLSESQIKRDRDSGRLIVAQSALLTLGNLAIIVYIINPRWMAWSSITLPLWLAWLGIGLGMAGTALLIWSHLALGENFFGGMKIRQSHRLVS